MELLKTLWKWLDGNKTIMGTFLLLLLSKFGNSWFSPDVVEVLNWILITLTGGSLVHHIKKGKLTTKKN